MDGVNEVEAICGFLTRGGGRENGVGVEWMEIVLRGSKLNQGRVDEGDKEKSRAKPFEEVAPSH